MPLDGGFDGSEFTNSTKHLMSKPQCLQKQHNNRNKLSGLNKTVCPFKEEVLYLTFYKDMFTNK